MSFSTIPILDLALSRNPKTKPLFLQDLRRAILEVGFLYVSNTGIDDTLISQVIQNGKAFFELPEAAKLAVQMKNEKSFLGIVFFFILFPPSPLKDIDLGAKSRGDG